MAGYRLTEYQKALIESLYKEDKSSVEISKITNISRGSIRRILRQKGLALKTSIDRSVGKFSSSSDKWSGYGEISGARWNDISYGARARGIEINLSIEDAWTAWESSGGICPYLNTKLFHPKTERDKKTGNWSASLDRINSNRGYTPDNIQWVHKAVNKMKINLSHERFIELCGYIKNPVSSVDRFIDATINISPHFYRLSRGAARRNIEFGISKKDIINLYLLQGGRCKLTNLNIDFVSSKIITNAGNPNYSTLGSTASVDRIDSRLGYNMSNIHLVHVDINLMKWDFKIEYFVDICIAIAENMRSKNGIQY